jgi:putative spermidine/putrescine transport system permease protein
MESKANGRRNSPGWLLILPLVLILVPFFIVPIIGVVVASFVQSDGSSLRGLPISCTGRP